MQEVEVGLVEETVEVEVRVLDGQDFEVVFEGFDVGVGVVGAQVVDVNENVEGFEQLEILGRQLLEALDFAGDFPVDDAE